MTTPKIKKKRIAILLKTGQTIPVGTFPNAKANQVAKKLARKYRKYGDTVLVEGVEVEEYETSI